MERFSACGEEVTIGYWRYGTATCVVGRLVNQLLTTRFPQCLMCICGKTNHSVRATEATRLFEAHVPEISNNWTQKSCCSETIWMHFSTAWTGSLFYYCISTGKTAANVIPYGVLSPSPPGRCSMVYCHPHHRVDHYHPLWRTVMWFVTETAILETCAQYMYIL